MAASPARQLIIRAARAITQLLDEAGDWMRSRGISDHRPTRFPLSDLAARLLRGERTITQRPSAPSPFDDHADPEFWHNDPTGTGARYLHRVAVARTHPGHGIVARLVEHAAHLAAANDRRWLRLDCAKHNARLRDYYPRLGFTQVGSIDLPHRSPARSSSADLPDTPVRTDLRPSMPPVDGSKSEPAPLLGGHR
jgi:predicted GNAT family N-acyltransferase